MALKEQQKLEKELTGTILILFFWIAFYEAAYSV